jgi:hypothetical protein
VFKIKDAKVGLLCECTQGGGTSHALVHRLHEERRDTLLCMNVKDRLRQQWWYTQLGQLLVGFSLRRGWDRTVPM